MRKVIDGPTGKEVAPSDLDKAFFALSADDFRFSRTEKTHIKKILKAELLYKNLDNRGEGPISKFLRAKK